MVKTLQMKCTKGGTNCPKNHCCFGCKAGYSCKRSCIQMFKFPEDCVYYKEVRKNE